MTAKKAGGAQLVSREAVKLATEAALAVWWRSCSRPDLVEQDRVKGALRAYQMSLDGSAVVADLTERGRVS